MILVTVGTQLPFNRLISSVEKWAIVNCYTDIMFQVGLSGYKPSVGRSVEFLQDIELQEYIKNSELVIGHAGTGTMISCLSISKPMVIMPRNHLYGEHRNNHQKATVAKLRDIYGVFVADTEYEMPQVISNALLAANPTEKFCFPESAQDSLVDHIIDVILHDIRL